VILATTVPIRCLASLRCIQSEPLLPLPSPARCPLEPRGWSPRVTALLPSRRPICIRSEALTRSAPTADQRPQGVKPPSSLLGPATSPPRHLTGALLGMSSPRRSIARAFARTAPRNRPNQAVVSTHAARASEETCASEETPRSPRPSDRALIATSCSLHVLSTSLTPAEARALLASRTRVGLGPIASRRKLRFLVSVVWAHDTNHPYVRTRIPSIQSRRTGASVRFHHHRGDGLRELALWNRLRSVCRSSFPAVRLSAIPALRRTCRPSSVLEPSRASFRIRVGPLGIRSTPTFVPSGRETLLPYGRGLIHGHIRFHTKVCAPCARYPPSSSLCLTDPFLRTGKYPRAALLADFNIRSAPRKAVSSGWALAAGRSAKSFDFAHRLLSRFGDTTRAGLPHAA